jgi:hypothetical protein
MNSGIIFIIVLFVLYALFFDKGKKSKRNKTRAAPKKSSVVSSGPYTQKEQRRFMAETVPALLQDYNVFLPCFYSRFAAEYIQTGHDAKIEQTDIVEGVDAGYAYWVLNHCCYLASMRFPHIKMIENAKDVEARYIKFSVFRSNPSCSLVPQNKKYKVGDKIPIFPCADCKEEKPCIFTYAYDW